MRPFILVPCIALLLTACGEKKKMQPESTAITDTVSNRADTIPAISDDQIPSIDEDNNTHPGSFTVDGKTIKGLISTEHFQTGGQNFSVICQQKDPFNMMQAVFVDEKEATGHGTLEPASNFYNVTSGSANIAIAGEIADGKEFTTTEASTGTIRVDGRKLILENLTLFDLDKHKKTINGTFAY